MQWIHYISGPVIGAAVGYITNYIAIKMLFRPRKPIMIGRFRVPFTPGIVPKRKDELAVILGKAVVDKFFNADDLEIVFKSDAMADAFADCVVALSADGNARLGDVKFSAGDDGVYGRLRDEICVRIQAALLRADLQDLLSYALVKVMEKRSSSRLGKAVGEELLPAVAGSFSDKIENFILYESRDIILPIIDDEIRELAAMPVAEISAAIFSDTAMLHDAAKKLHQTFMLKYVRTIVESVDVGGMITEKVKQMTPGEVEGLVTGVVHRELRYIVLLGALLGFVIGAINIFT